MQDPNPQYEAQESNEILEGQLRAADIGQKRSADVEDGTKTCYDHDDQRLPTGVPGNYTVHGGDGLVILDIDVSIDELPEWVDNLPSTFVVESPHGGYHLYYAVEDDDEIDSAEADWGSVRYEGQYVVGPGSTIVHAECDDLKEDCPGEGVGKYDIEVDKPIATLSGNHLDNLREACESSNNADEEFDLQVVEYLDGSITEKGQQALHDLQDESAWTFNAVTEFLQGGIPEGFADDRLRKDGGRIDRSSTTYVALSLLYSTVGRYVDTSEHDLRQITYQTFTRYCREHPKTNDGQKRRWLIDTEDWRRDRLKYAIGNADADRFEAMVTHSGTGARCDNNEYSQLTYNAIWQALYELLPHNPPQLSNDMDPANPATESTETGAGRIALRERYPGKDEVVDRAYEIDDGYNEWSSYEEAFRRLQSNYGEVKAARIGNDWVYYPTDYPDPPEACYLKHNGEQKEPTVPDSIQSGDQTVEGDEEGGYTTRPSTEKDVRHPIHQRERREHRLREASHHRAESRRQTQVERRRERVSQL